MTFELFGGERRSEDWIHDNFDREEIKNAFWQAAATIGYISIVSAFLFTSKDLSWGESSIFIPIIMLSLFVFSAAMTSSLIFGQPILWYLDGKKKEAVYLFISTLLFFLLFTIVALVAVFYL